MSKEGGSFRGGGVATAARSVSAAPSISRSFSAERTGAMSFKIGPTKSVASSGMRFGEFHPSAPTFSDRKVQGINLAKMVDFMPGAPAAKRVETKTNRFSGKVEQNIFSKPRGEKAGLAPYKGTLVRNEPKIIMPHLRPIEKNGLRVDLTKRSRVSLVKPEKRLSPKAEHNVNLNKAPSLTVPVVRKESPTVLPKRDMALEKKVAQAYLKAGLVSTPQQAEAKVAAIVTEKQKKIEWANPAPARHEQLPSIRIWDAKAPAQVTRQLEMPVSLTKKTEAAQTAALIREIRSLANATPRGEKVVMPHMDLNIVIADEKEEKKKKKTPKVYGVFGGNAREKQKYFIFDSLAAIARKNMVMLTAVQMFVKKGSDQLKKITGRDLASLLPQTAPQQALSEIVRGRSNYDGSYEEFREKIGAVSEFKNVGEAIDTADRLNYTAPPVKVDESKDGKRDIKRKDVRRVFHGPQEEIEED